MKHYIAMSSFYDTDAIWPICAGTNKRKVIKMAVKILQNDHKDSPFPLHFLGLRSRIDGSMVKIEEIPFVS